MRTWFFVLFIFYVQLNIAQNPGYVRFIVDTLSSPGMNGRGYVNDGDKKAAAFINNEFENLKLQFFGEDYYQPFFIPMNTFPGKLQVKIDYQLLKPGEDFVVLSSSPSVSGTFKLMHLPSDSTGAIIFPENLQKITFSEIVLVTDINQRNFVYDKKMPFAGVVFLNHNKVWWHVSNGASVENYFSLQVSDKVLFSGSEIITVQIQNQYYSNYPTQNVVSYVQGKEKPDSFIVFTAHYDHLGQMGRDVYFPGGNDNASGTATLLDLANHFSKPGNRPGHTIVFIAFGAEEAGLLGSGYFVDNPLFPLDQIVFLINFDMVGSGSEGIKVVNGSVHEFAFNTMVNINNRKNYLEKISARGAAANSDHYPFFAKGVPSFFIYTLGNECKEYHNIYDTPENVPFTAYEGLFRLILDFVNTM